MGTEPRTRDTRAEGYEGQELVCRWITSCTRGPQTSVRPSLGSSCRITAELSLRVEAEQKQSAGPWRPCGLWAGWSPDRRMRDSEMLYSEPCQQWELSQTKASGKLWASLPLDVLMHTPGDQVTAQWGHCHHSVRCPPVHGAQVRGAAPFLRGCVW